MSIRPEDLEIGRNYIVDKRTTTRKLRNDQKESVDWYQFRIPLREYERRVGGITDLTSVRFMRMFLTGFKHPIVLRFGTLDLVRGEWRVYEQNLDNTSSSTGTLQVSAVNIEENNDKTPVNYVLPPGISREQDPTQPQLVENNEQALSMTVNNLASGESKAVYKNTSIDMRQYKRLQMFVHANSFEQNMTNLENGQLSVFVRLGSDYKNNFYEYEIPLKLTPHRNDYNKYSTADRLQVWPKDNMLDIPLSLLTGLKRERNKAKAIGQASYNRPYSAYDTDNPQNRITIVGNPTLGDVKTMIIGVRNNSASTKSGEVWVNELRLKDYNSSGGWAAQGNLNVQLSDLGNVNVQGRYTSAGFGGLEDGVAQRSTDDYSNYSVTTNVELGKFFPDKAKVSAPLYYSITKEKTSPKYNPLDNDMLLDEALDAAANKHERDSIESIAVTKVTQTNLSLSNVRVGIQTKRHPMPYDPANFSFSYSHSHSYTTGETTVYEREDNWRGAMNYQWSPVYKPLEPFKKIKSKSKWLDLPRRFGLNWLPQNVGFNTEITRNYYELQERDMEATENQNLPLTFASQFLRNREFNLRWDLTKNLHMNFQSATNAEIEEPYMPVNKDLYPDRYEVWKDSVWTSIKHMGTPLNYNQQFQASYKLPINLLPVFDWITSDASYTASYNWVRGTDLEDGTSLGNNIANNRQANINAQFNMEKLYNHIPFLKKTNERFRRDSSRSNKSSQGRNKTSGKDAKNNRQTARDEKLRRQLPKNKRAYEKEITLLPDTTLKVTHSRKTRRLIVSAKTEDGKPFRLRYRRLDDNNIRIMNKVDSALKLKIAVSAKEPLDEKRWYRTAQSVARVLMMVRNVSLSYRNQYAMSLPGFKPMIGDVFGQRSGMGAMSPGLDFAFGFIGDGYIEKARRNGWLLMNDSLATPATTNRTEELQLRATLEPVRNLKIDLTATRTVTTARSVQYMYEGNPTTQSGTFTMTTTSLRSAFEGSGNANNGYRSKSFDRFCSSLDRIRDRVEARYAGAVYPAGTALAGKPFSAENGGVSRYSADVMVPAFLSAYTEMGDGGLSIFPSLSHLLPNWTLRYSGLSKLPWLRDVFKSVNISHAYKSIYAVGSYASYSTYMEYMNGLGFINDATTGMPVPNSMFNVSTVSINEAFSPLLGIEVTLQNNMTIKAEYRTTRVMSLSMTSVQINEASSHDWVIGAAYTLNNFNPFGGNRHRRVRQRDRSTAAGASQQKTGYNSRNTSSTGVNNDLKLRLDLSLRKQASITRDIATRTSAANSGNTAFKLSFSADYTLSRLLTMSFYYDRQTNTPLLSSSSYPTTTQDFGLSMKFSLTR